MLTQLAAITKIERKDEGLTSQRWPISLNSFRFDIMNGPGRSFRRMTAPENAVTVLVAIIVPTVSRQDDVARIRTGRQDSH